MTASAIQQYDYTETFVKLAQKLASCQAILSSSNQVLQIFPIAKEKRENPHRVLNWLEKCETQKINQLLQILSCELQIPTVEFRWLPPPKPSSLEMALSRFCALTLEDWKTLLNYRLGEQSFREFIRDLKQSYILPFAESFNVGTEDLPEFSVFSEGKHSNEAVILVPPCAVPARFFKPWLEELGKQYFTIILENPFLFSRWKSLPEPSDDILLELKYIQATMQALGISKVHFIGICGGAPIALAAAQKFCKEVGTVTICHGDLNLGKNTPKTAFQNQFYGLLVDATQSVTRAKEVYEMFMDPSLLFGIPDSLGPFILYPYSDLKLFQRYAKLNAALMSFDLSSFVNELKKPLMVVTNPNDRMAAPQASYLLHEKVKGSVIWQHNIVSHHDGLLGSPELFIKIVKFIKENYEKYNK